MESTSLSLINQIRDPHDEAAWGRFAKLYTPMLIACVERLGLQREEALDVVQDVLLLLQRKLPDFEYDAGKRFRGWLRTVSVNKCRDYLRKRKRDAGQIESGELRRLAAGDDIELFTDREYHEHLVRQAMTLMQAEFEEKTWRACWEVTVAERPAADVAVELGITVNAVYVAKSRVLRKLREMLAGLLE